MIRWTTSGAVATPTTVQIRVQRSYPGRVRAGAPVPTRSLSPEEFLSNVRYFTAGLRTPRAHPCTVLVLSGVGVVSRPDTPAAIDAGRAEGIERVVLHAGFEDLHLLDPGRYSQRADVLVVPVDPAGGSLPAAMLAIQQAAAADLRVAANVVLSRAALPHLSTAAGSLVGAGPRDVVFTYPFPLGAGGDPPPPAAAAQALEPAVGALSQAGIGVSIKGLPACMLGGLANFLRRSANRWYVDADHQTAQALLFFPDVVAFHKADACRFCSADAACDGFFAAWLGLPGFPALHPIG